MNTKHTPEQQATDALSIYADGLDACVDGRGYNHSHEVARQSIIKAFTDRADLVTALEMARRVIGAGPHDDDVLGPIDAALALARDKQGE